MFRRITTITLAVLLTLSLLSLGISRQQRHNAIESVMASASAAKIDNSFGLNDIISGQDQSDQTREKSDQDMQKPQIIRVYERQITKTQIDLPNDGFALRVINNAKSDGDIDITAFDLDGNEVARETVTVPADGTLKINLQETFPELDLNSLSVVEIQASAKPIFKDNIDTQNLRYSSIASQNFLAVAFFSQRDSRWKYNQLGTCKNTTIGSAGCAITAIAMAGARSVNNWNPATVNDYLKNNYGYASGCLVKWAAPAKVDGTDGFTYLNSATVSSAANLKALVDNSKFAVAKSYRFSTHYTIIIGYNGTGSKLSDFVYLDPWDLSATFRTVGDGWVTSTSSIQIYR